VIAATPGDEAAASDRISGAGQFRAILAKELLQDDRAANAVTGSTKHYGPAWLRSR